MSYAKSFLVTFSGMDGAGKSTQIDNLRGFLEAHGLRTRTLALWDDVVVLSRYREGFVHKVFKSERGIGAPGKPVSRRDKNVRGWHVNLARHGLYLLDAFNLRRVLARAGQADVLIMDRYIYDELANLPLGNPLTRAFIRLVAAFVPAPDVAYALDADPEAARGRKPEYPLNFLITCRESYRALAAMLNLTTIPPSSIAEAAGAVERALVEAWKRTRGGTLGAQAADDTDEITHTKLRIAG